MRIYKEEIDAFGMYYRSYRMTTTTTTTKKTCTKGVLALLCFSPPPLSISCVVAKRLSQLIKPPVRQLFNRRQTFISRSRHTHAVSARLFFFSFFFFFTKSSGKFKSAKMPMVESKNEHTKHIKRPSENDFLHTQVKHAPQQQPQ